MFVFQIVFMERYTFKVQNLFFFSEIWFHFLLIVTYEAWVQDHNYFFLRSKKSLRGNFSISYYSRRLQHMGNLLTVICIHSIGKSIRNSQIFGNSLHQKTAKDSILKTGKEKSSSNVWKSNKKKKEKNVQEKKIIDAPSESYWRICLMKKFIFCWSMMK